MSDIPKQNRIVDSTLFSKRVSECYTARRYPLSRKHKRQMISRRKRESRRSRRKLKTCSRPNDPSAIQRGGGGNGSVIFREDVQVPVKIDYAIDILSQCVEGVFETELISSEAPIKPKGGDMFVIDTQLFSNKISRRIDQYQWVNDGSKKYPTSNTVLIKSNWRIKTAAGNANNRKGSGSSAFKRTEYGLVNNDRYFLIHYIGDETAFEDMPHGNAKKSD